MWHIKEMMVNEQWSLRQISRALSKEGIKVSHQSIYNLTHNDPTKVLAANTHHRLKSQRQALPYCPQKRVSPTFGGCGWKTIWRFLSGTECRQTLQCHTHYCGTN